MSNTNLNTIEEVLMSTREANLCKRIHGKTSDHVTNQVDESCQGSGKHNNLSLLPQDVVAPEAKLLSSPSAMVTKTEQTQSTDEATNNSPAQDPQSPKATPEAGASSPVRASNPQAQKAGRSVSPAARAAQNSSPRTGEPASEDGANQAINPSLNTAAINFNDHAASLHGAFHPEQLFQPQPWVTVHSGGGNLYRPIPYGHPSRSFGSPNGPANVGRIPISNLPAQFLLESSSRNQPPLMADLPQPPQGNAMTFPRLRRTDCPIANQIPMLNASSPPGSYEASFFTMMNQAMGDNTGPLQAHNVPIQQGPGTRNVRPALSIPMERLPSIYERRRQSVPRSTEPGSPTLQLLDLVAQNRAPEGPSTPGRGRRVRNSLYDPMYEAMGLPVDPHLRMFLLLDKNDN